jgi:hypothetical protein
MSASEAVREQLELIRSSLLPTEKLILSSDETPTTLLTFEIISKESTYSIHVVEQEHSDEDANTLRRFRFQIRSTEMNRDEALGWETWVEEVVRDHGKEAEQGGYPLSTLITEHFLPLLQSLTTREEPKVDAKAKGEGGATQRTNYRPGHILFSSHHLLAPSKRKNLVSLSSQLGLVGFGKVGYPGIIFAEGDVEDLEEFSREVCLIPQLAPLLLLGLTILVYFRSKAGSGLHYDYESSSATNSQIPLRNNLGKDSGRN